MDIQKWAQGVNIFLSQGKISPKGIHGEQALDIQRLRQHILWVSVSLSPESLQCLLNTLLYNVVMAARMRLLMGSTIWTYLTEAGLAKAATVCPTNHHQGQVLNTQNITILWEFIKPPGTRLIPLDLFSHGGGSGSSSLT